MNDEERKQKREGVQQQIDELLQRAAEPTAGNVVGFASTFLAAQLQILLLKAKKQDESAS